MWKMKPYVVYFLNSFITAGVAASISVLFGALAAYSISRFRSKVLRSYLAVVLCIQTIPGVMLVGPYFRLLTKINLYNTRTGLILGYIATTLAFSIWILKGYFDSIPKELDESALIDGCSRLKALFYIVVPLSIPGMIAAWFLIFLMAWGDLLWALCLTSSDEVTTVSLGIASTIGELRVVWPALMAAAIVACIPPIVIYFALQRHFIGGMSTGAVKG